MEQVQSRGVIIMGKSKYQEECLMILENDNFLVHDPTKKRKKNTTNFMENEKQIIRTRQHTFMEQPNYTKNIEMTQLMNFQYGQMFQILELRHTI